MLPMPNPAHARANYQAQLRKLLIELGTELRLDLLDVWIASPDGSRIQRAACATEPDGRLHILATGKGAQALVGELEGWLRGFRAARRAEEGRSLAFGAEATQGAPVAAGGLRLVPPAPDPVSQPGPAQAIPGAPRDADPDLDLERGDPLVAEDPDLADREDLVGL